MHCSLFTFVTLFALRLDGYIGNAEQNKKQIHVPIDKSNFRSRHLLNRLALLGDFYTLMDMEMHSYTGRHCRCDCVVPLSALSSRRRRLHSIQGDAHLPVAASYFAHVRAARLR